MHLVMTTAPGQMHLVVTTWQIFGTARNLKALCSLRFEREIKDGGAVAGESIYEHFIECSDLLGLVT